MGAPIVDAYEILERITDGFFALDEKWNFTYVNVEATRLLFRSQEDLLGRNIWREFPVAVDLPFYNQYHKAVYEQIPVKFDAFFPPLKTWFEVRAYPSFNGLSVYFQDITEKKLAVAKKEQHYKSLFEQNPDAVFSFDLEGNYLSVNPAMEQLLGYSEEELLHRSFVPLVTEADLEPTLRHYQMAADGITQRYHTKALHKDGSIVHVDVTNMPIILDGEVVGVYGIAKDITARIAEQDELEKTTERLESFIENNVDSILIFDTKSQLLRVNRAFQDTFGWSQEEILGTALCDLPLIPAGLLEEAKSYEAKVLEGSLVVEAETIRLRRDGVQMNVLISLFPIYDAQGEMDGWSAILRDVTEWKKSQLMLQNTEKLSVAGQLAAGIAHEIRNPITAIKGFIHLMKAEGAGDKEKYFDIMSSECERIEQILSELLILSKPQASTFDQKDMKILLAQIVTLLETQAIISNVELVTEFHTDLTHIHCDENRMKQVLINFMKNSIEAMSTGGRIMLQVGDQDREKMIIRIIDQGPGMPKEILSKIGQPFFTTKEKGTGLGFMISKKIIENHYGEVRIESEVNKGTTVEMLLPYSI